MSYTYDSGSGQSTPVALPDHFSAAWNQAASSLTGSISLKDGDVITDTSGHKRLEFTDTGGTIIYDEANNASLTIGTDQSTTLTGILTATGGLVYGTETKAVGALTPAIAVSIITIDGTKAYSLADGATAGTVKHITVKTVANTPNGTLTPTTTSGTWATAQFDTVGQSLTLLWDGAGWAIIGTHHGSTSGASGSAAVAIAT